MGVLSLLLVAVFLLWALGAYNRLVRLRMATRAALTPLASLWRQRHAVALTLAETSRQRLGSAGDLTQVDTLIAAAREASQAVDAVQNRPLHGQVLRQAVVAETALLAAVDALALTLQDLTSGDGPDAAVSELLRQRDSLQHAIGFAGHVYDAAAVDYNSALTVFPTPVVAALFRFLPAPALPREREPGGVGGQTAPMPLPLSLPAPTHTPASPAPRAAPDPVDGVTPPR